MYRQIERLEKRVTELETALQEERTKRADDFQRCWNGYMDLRYDFGEMKKSINEKGQDNERNG